MIRLTDINGRLHFLRPDAIARVSQPGDSSAWYGVRAYVATFDQQLLEVRESVDDILKQIDAERE